MVTMENSEEILQVLERYTRLKQKDIPKELDEYFQYVAKTGDTVFKWTNLKYLFREKLLHVIKHFNEDSSRLEEIPNYPNVDPFNYETMKSSLLERLDLFNAAPFTVQRLCELLIDPRKQYTRIDKYMRALEKNILVVSTIEPGRKRAKSENGDSRDSMVNGDVSLEVNIDIEMENEGMFNNVGNGINNGDAEHVKNDSNSLPMKNNCPRSDDDTLQPRAKKVRLAYDDEDDDDDNEHDRDADDQDEEPVTSAIANAIAIATRADADKATKESKLNSSASKNETNNDGTSAAGKDINLRVDVVKDDAKSIADKIDKQHEEKVRSDDEYDNDEDDDHHKIVEKEENEKHKKQNEDDNDDEDDHRREISQQIASPDEHEQSDDDDDDDDNDNENDNNDDNDNDNDEDDEDSDEKQNNGVSNANDEDVDSVDSAEKENSDGETDNEAGGGGDSGDGGDGSAGSGDGDGDGDGDVDGDIEGDVDGDIDGDIDGEVDALIDARNLMEKNDLLKTDCEIADTQVAAEVEIETRSDVEETHEVVIASLETDQEPESEPEAESEQESEPDIEEEVEVKDNTQLSPKNINVNVIEEEIVESELNDTDSVIAETQPVPIETDELQIDEVESVSSNETTLTTSAELEPNATVTVIPIQIAADVEVPLIETSETVMTLNDQPMEVITPVDEESNSSNNIIEEVIMAENSGSNEMATDAVDIDKNDNDAGMEVDDTSQEAMDQ